MEHITFTETTLKDGMKHNHRRDRGFYTGYKVLSLDSENVKEILDIRFYCPSSQVYCCVWLRDDKNKIWFSGSGIAGGYGYDRESAAFANALESMGVKVRGVSGAGMNYAGEKAINEIIEILGYEKTYIVKIHE